jgi:hypothetical protein
MLWEGKMLLYLYRVSIVTFIVLGMFGRLAIGSEKNEYTNPTVGFKVTKPSTWNYISAETITTNRENIRLKDEDLRAAIRERATPPLVAMTKYKEPYDDLNPTISIVFRPAGSLQGKPATEIMSAVVRTMQNALHDFKFIREIHETEISGLKASHMRATYRISNKEGRDFSVVSRMWMVPRGAFIFLIGMSGPRSGQDVSEAEFDQVLQSIKIEK